MIKTYILEEHNEAFLVWNYLKSRTEFINNSVLLHIDHHSDLTPPLMKLCLNPNEKNLDIIKDITYNEISISSFIIPAVYIGLFDKIIWLKKLDINGDKTFYKQINTKKNVNTFFSVKDIMSNTRTNTNDICFEFIVSGLSSIEKIMADVSIFALDIDLDFFSCNENPFFEKPVKIQISENEYKKFMLNKYHWFRYLFPNFRVSAIKENENYYYVLNDFDDPIMQKYKVSTHEVRKRIDLLIETLKNVNIKPVVITISKSINSGYTPIDQVSDMLDYLLERLSLVYELDIIRNLDII